MAIIAPPKKIRENRRMKRLKVLFAVGLLLLFFPFWRGLDYQVAFIPSAWLYTFSLMLILLFFILLPIRLLFPEVAKKFLFMGYFVFSILVWFGSPLSDKATRHHELRHCGASTYSGFLYHARAILPPAHHDDIDARNQMCWVRKMVVRMPEEISDVKELQNYLELLRQKLLSPSVKYKTTLPLIALLHAALSAGLVGPVMESVEIGKMFFDSLHFWKSQYTTEISELEYPWYAWPHSSWIKWEYGLIEKNWETIIEGIKYEEN